MAYLILQGGKSGGYFDFDPQSCNSMSETAQLISERFAGRKKVTLLAASSDDCDCEHKSILSKLISFFTAEKDSGKNRFYRSSRPSNTSPRSCRTPGRKSDLSVV